MTTQERINEIKENLLWMADRPGVSVAAAYDDPHYNKHTLFTTRTRKEFNERITKYAEEHPVE